MCEAADRIASVSFLPQIVLRCPLLTRKFNILSLYIAFVIKSLLNINILSLSTFFFNCFLIINWVYFVCISLLLIPQNRLFFWPWYSLELGQLQQFDAAFHSSPESEKEYRGSGEMYVTICHFPLNQKIRGTIFLDYFYFFLTHQLLPSNTREISHSPDPGKELKRKARFPSCRKLPAAFNLQARVKPCFCYSHRCSASLYCSGPQRLL